jgi:hypothetical protein
MAASPPRQPGEPEPPLRYEEITKNEYAEHAATTFSAEPTGGGAIVVRGSCMRCGHLMEYLIGHDVVRVARWRPASRARPAPPAAEELEHVEHMICTCEGDHPGKPEQFTGCGAFWDLAVSQP